MKFLSAQDYGAGADAPSGAPAGEGQPSFLANHVPNTDPTIQDWVSAYQPVDQALNKAFETRITKDNARQVQWELAIVRCSSPHHHTAPILSPKESTPQ